MYVGIVFRDTTKHMLRKDLLSIVSPEILTPFVWVDIASVCLEGNTVQKHRWNVGPFQA